MSETRNVSLNVTAASVVDEAVERFQQQRQPPVGP
jgi:hypothetical protein